MKDAFPGYYRLERTELAELWRKCVFVFDANVLLNLYRYPKGARDDLLGVLDQISDRIWLPHQVALEFQENRLNVIAEQVAKFDEVRKVIKKTQNDLEHRTG